MFTSSVVRRIAQALLVVAIVAGVALVARRPGSEPVAVLPDVAPQFSLDMNVVETIDYAVVYVVEQRARPAYRIFAFDPATGTDTTVFTVPEDAIIYGIALSPDRSTLAVSYSPDYRLEGSGIWTLDVATQDFTQVTAAKPDVYLTEPEFNPDGTALFVTHVDRREVDEQLAIAEVVLADGTTRQIADRVITPAVRGDELYGLVLDDDNARHAIGRIAADGSVAVVPVGDGSLDLDHLIAASGAEPLSVAVLETDDGGLSIGEEASAHGNHTVRSAWWSVEIDGIPSEATSLEPIIVYDAAATDSSIVYATLEGLAIAGDKRIDLIESRAIRFVAA